jgi:hypothetical protein
MSKYPTKGKFCRKLREVTAVRVRRDNEEQLQQLVLGGRLIKMDPQWVFVFGGEFSWKKRTAFEGDWIVTEDGVNFEVMTDEQFRAEYEPK